ncbi:MAG: CvpA family protein [Deltaproteobacteria bacterium]|nr:CvpA family protein [Deltaproteobacteria bacterium]
MLTSLDVVIIFLVLAGAYLGYSRGLLAEIIALVGVVLGIILASRFYLAVAEGLQPLLRDQELSRFIAYLVIYGAGVLGFFLIYLVVKSNMTGGPLGTSSRLAAALLGAFKSAVFVVMVLFLVIFFWGPDNDFTSGARLLPRFLPHCRFVVNLLPEPMQEPLTEFVETLSPETQEGENK